MAETSLAGAVLFDLDGTFADTAPDMAAALNRLLARYDRPPVPLAQARRHVSSGSRGMLAVGFGLVPGDPDYEPLRTEYLELYAADIHCDTCLFPGIAELVEALESRQTRWGIVTNKPGWLTDPLLEAMALPFQPDCVVSGDTAARAKPHPDPLFHACGLIHCDPRACWYVGDDQRDILAGRAAGMRTLAALYGYLGVERHPRDWGADGLLEHPLEVLRFLDVDAPIGVSAAAS
ncbi:MAG: phosphoglycolate phosphatase [Halochromatium sp.]|nr:phosphoglycolate phosphatase [Halochromatium sp.]